MQRFLYLQQHRKCLYQGISCVFLFVFLFADSNVNIVSIFFCI